MQKDMQHLWSLFKQDTIFGTEVTLFLSYTIV
jgi:hypothetical protein